MGEDFGGGEGEEVKGESWGEIGGGESVNVLVGCDGGGWHLLIAICWLLANWYGNGDSLAFQCLERSGSGLLWRVSHNL